MHLAMSSLEGELEAMSSVNEQLKREVAAKSELAERQSVAAAELRQQNFSLETDAHECGRLRQELEAERGESAAWRGRSHGHEQRAALLARAVQLQTDALREGSARLLRPYGEVAGAGRADEPLAWQSQLAAELRALLESELLRRAGAAMDETRWALYAPEVFTSKLKAGEAPPRASAARASAVASDSGSTALGHWFEGDSWWLAPASELRRQRGEILAAKEQQKREARVAVAALTNELDVLERQGPEAAAALRAMVEPLPEQLQRLRETHEAEAAAAAATAEERAAAAAEAARAEMAAEVDSLRAQLRRSNLARAGVEEQAAQDAAASAALAAELAEARAAAVAARRDGAERLEAVEKAAAAATAALPPRCADALRRATLEKTARGWRSDACSHGRIGCARCARRRRRRAGGGGGGSGSSTAS